MVVYTKSNSIMIYVYEFDHNLYEFDLSNLSFQLTLTCWRRDLRIHVIGMGIRIYKSNDWNIIILLGLHLLKL